MAKAAPSILAADFTELKKDIQMVEDAGCDLLHLDVMDGHFVPNLSYGPFIIKQIDFVSDLPLDVHLMISNPEKYIDAYIDAGADYLTVHGEVIGNDPSLLLEIKSKGVKAGLALNPDADIQDYKELFQYLDMFLVMSVYAGFGGQNFLLESLEKIKTAVKWREAEKLDFLISIDGGINESTAKLAKDAGADVLVAGSACFRAKDIKSFISLLQS